jgi:hypothetical protein
MYTNKFLKFFSSKKVQSAVGIIFSLLAIATLIVSLRATSEQQKQSQRLETYVKCQGEWTNFLYQAITANRDASREANAALDELINTISTSTSREQSTAALEKYKAARAKQIQSQNEHPLPEAPKQVCQLEEK